MQCGNAAPGPAVSKLVASANVPAVRKDSCSIDFITIRKLSSFWSQMEFYSPNEKIATKKIGFGTHPPGSPEAP